MCNMSCAQKLVDHFGGKDEVCAALEINPETLRLWLRDGIPLARALYVERETDGGVTADEILREAREAA